MKQNAKQLARLAERLQNPLRGIGVMHYSLFAPAVVTEAYNQLSDEFKNMYTLSIPRLHHEAKATNSGFKYKVMGCYWVLERK